MKKLFNSLALSLVLVFSLSISAFADPAGVSFDSANNIVVDCATAVICEPVTDSYGRESFVVKFENVDNLDALVKQFAAKGLMFRRFKAPGDVITFKADDTTLTIRKDYIWDFNGWSDESGAVMYLRVRKSGFGLKGASPAQWGKVLSDYFNWVQ